VTLTKQIRFLRYIYFLEGLVFLLGAAFLLPRHGIAAMLGLSVFCSGLFTGAYGLVRVRRYLAVHWTEVRRQLLPGLGRVAAILVPVAAAACWLTQPLGAWPSLLVRAGVLGPLGGLLLLRFGLAPELQRELLARVATRWRPVLASVLGGTAPERPPPGQSAGGGG